MKTLLGLLYCVNIIRFITYLSINYTQQKSYQLNLCSYHIKTCSILINQQFQKRFINLINKMGLEQSSCFEQNVALEIPSSFQAGLQLNLQPYKDHIPSRNYARRSIQRPNLPRRVQDTIKNVAKTQPLKNQNLKGYQFPCFFILKKKIYYIGQWLNGLPHGKGRAYFSNGCFFQGWFEQGDATGQDNLFIYYDGSFYRGAFNKSKKNGFGKYIHHNGFTYSGLWQNDKPHGDQGEQIFPDGSKYFGSFFNGLKQGHGQYFWPDGKIYIGSFKNGCMEGHGLLKKGTESFYQGNFHINKKSGTGTMKLPFGVYEGSFQDGLMSGQGLFKWNDGRIYKGHFVDGKLHGQGVLTLMNGIVITGTWEHGQNVSIEQVKQQNKRFANKTRNSADNQKQKFSGKMIEYSINRQTELKSSKNRNNFILNEKK